MRHLKLIPDHSIAYKLHRTRMSLHGSSVNRMSSRYLVGSEPKALFLDNSSFCFRKKLYFTSSINSLEVWTPWSLLSMLLFSRTEACRGIWIETTMARCYGLRPTESTFWGTDKLTAINSYNHIQNRTKKWQTLNSMDQNPQNPLSPLISILSTRMYW